MPCWLAAARAIAFNSANTAITPWNTTIVRGFLRSDTGFQFGHGNNAVETQVATSWADVSWHAAPSGAALQFGYGNNAVEHTAATHAPENRRWSFDFGHGNYAVEHTGHDVATSTAATAVVDPSIRPRQ